MMQVGIGDNVLLLQLASGDTSAFETIYHRYSKSLFHFCNKNIFRKEDSEEILQDVFISLWERREHLQITSLKQYLFSAVRYKIIRYIQHNKVKQKYVEHFRNFEQVYDEIAEPKKDQSEVFADVEKHLGPLPDRCKHAFLLRLHENLTNAEIAARMNISKKTVEVYMFKAYQHLRAAIPN